MVGVTVVGARRRRRVLAGGSGTVLALSDDHLLALVCVDILIAVVVALGPLSCFLEECLCLEQCSRHSQWVVEVLAGALLLRALSNKVTRLSTVAVGLPSSLAVVEGTLKLVNHKCEFLVAHHLQLLIYNRHKGSQREANRRRVSTRTAPTN